MPFDQQMHTASMIEWQRGNTQYSYDDFTAYRRMPGPYDAMANIPVVTK